MTEAEIMERIHLLGALLALNEENKKLLYQKLSMLKCGCGEDFGLTVGDVLGKGVNHNG